MMRAVLAAALLGLLVPPCLSVPAHARDLGQWGNAPAAERDWFARLMMPDNPTVSCCGEGDAYWADEADVEDGQVYAVITDERPDEPLRRAHIAPGTRFLVPPEKITRKDGNPTGHVIIFIAPVSQAVLCYVMNGGV